MARIKPIESQQGFVLPSAGASPRRATAEDFGGGSSSTTAGFSKLIDDAVSFFDKQEERAAKQWAAKTLAEDAIYWSQYMAEAEKQSGPGGEGFVDKVSADLDARLQSHLSSASPRIQEEFSTDYTRMIKARVLGQAVDHASRAAVVKIKQDYDDVTSVLQNGIMGGSLALDAGLQQLRENAVPATGLSAEAQRELLQKGTASLYDAAATRFITTASEQVLTAPGAARAQLSALRTFLAEDATKQGLNPNDYEKAVKSAAALESTIRAQQVAIGVQDFKTWTEAARMGAADERSRPALPAGISPQMAKALSVDAAQALAIGQASNRAWDAVATQTTREFMAQNSAPVATTDPAKALIAATTQRANMDALARILAIPPGARVDSAPAGKFPALDQAREAYNSVVARGGSTAELLAAESRLKDARDAASNQMGVQPHEKLVMDPTRVKGLVLEWQDALRTGGQASQAIAAKAEGVFRVYGDQGAVLARQLEEAKAPPDMIAFYQNLGSPGAQSLILRASTMDKTKAAVDPTVQKAANTALGSALEKESQAYALSGQVTLFDQMKQSAQNVAAMLLMENPSLSPQEAANRAADTVFRQKRSGVDTGLGHVLAPSGMSAYQIAGGVQRGVKSIAVEDLLVPGSVNLATERDRETYYKRMLSEMRVATTHDGKGVMLLNNSLDHTPVRYKDGRVVTFTWEQLDTYANAPMASLGGPQPVGGSGVFPSGAPRSSPAAGGDKTKFSSGLPRP